MSADTWPDITAYAEKLGVLRSWVRNAVTARTVHFTKVGRHVRFSPEDQEANRLMWSQQPARTPSAVVVHIPIRARRSA